jgi:hypothetical protein
MIKRLPGELWKTIPLPGEGKKDRKYAFSSLGRIASYKKSFAEDAKLLRGSMITGYRTFPYRRSGKETTLYLH